MQERITIRGGVVFIPKNFRMAHVSIYDATVVAPTDFKSDAEQAIRDCCIQQVNIENCVFLTRREYAEREARAALRFISPVVPAVGSWLQRVKDALTRR